MTEKELQEELDEIKKQIQQLSPRGFSSDLVLRLQSQLSDISLRLEAHSRVLKMLLPKFEIQYEATYSDLKKQLAASGQADYDSW